MAHESGITELNFPFRPAQREEFVTGDLRSKWAVRYPQLFDERDVEIGRNQPDRHFYEWLAAILIFEATGYLSLVEKYWSASHPRKLAIYEAVAPESVVNLDEDYGWPDLFCYSPDGRHFHFCEVKGHRDSLKDAQLRLFPKLFDLTGERVWVVNLSRLGD